MMSLWNVLLLLGLIQCVLAVCPDGWIRRGNSCYFISTELHASGDSVIYCLTNNATLAQVDDVQEMKFLREIVKRFPTDATAKQYYWIDGTRSQSNGISQWVRNIDRTPITYFAWGSGKPSNLTGNSCLALFNQVDFLFADTSCYNNGLYICELSDPVQSCVKTTPPPMAGTTGSWITLG
ncbi:C-type lectin domain family 17, member A-like [Argopecten irradians]|uniref:C-type lectin domain family 17, member A-like n=1 Tax=Argopecten irradians TaxID=31199 RepID=UPI0037104523